MPHVAVLVLVASTLATPLAAQVCQPVPSSNEAKTLAIFSVPRTFGLTTAPDVLSGLPVGLEGAYLPNTGKLDGLVAAIRAHGTTGRSPVAACAPHDQLRGAPP